MVLQFYIAPKEITLSSKKILLALIYLTGVK